MNAADDAGTGLSRRPYLLRAMHEWMGDAGFTPHIIVDAGRSGVEVPNAYIKDGKIVLNVSLNATQRLQLLNTGIEFSKFDIFCAIDSDSLLEHDALLRIAPAQREQILANRAGFLSRLETARARWSETLAPFAGTKLIAYHNSWPYFARRFRLDVIAFIEPKAGVAPSPAHLAQVISAGSRANVRAIVHEPYEPDDASRLVARKLSVPMVRLAISVGSIEGTNDYLTLFEYNVATLAKALAARSP